jgi:hypothetical protein
MSQTMHRRSTSGLSEHRPLDSFSGSIGITRRGKVHRGGALVGVGVERLAGLDVVADVGDRHQQAPALEGRLPRPRLAGSQYTASSKSRASSPSMVTSGTSVRSTRCAVGGAPCRAAPRPAPCGGENSVRHAVLAHRDLDLHARVVDLAQHLDHAPDRLRVQRRRLGQFDRPPPGPAWPCRWRPWGSGRPGRSACPPGPPARHRPRAAAGR